MKQTSIKYRLSNIKTFLYHVGARTRIISSQNHLQHGTQARHGKNSAVLTPGRNQCSPSLSVKGSRSSGDPPASQALWITHAPQNPRSTEQKWWSPVPLRQMNYCFPNFSSSVDHRIVTEFPWLSSNPLPFDNRTWTRKTGQSSMTCLSPLRQVVQLRSSKPRVMWKGRAFGPLGTSPPEGSGQKIQGNPDCKNKMAEPTQLPPLLLHTLYEAWLEDKDICLV